MGLFGRKKDEDEDPSFAEATEDRDELRKLKKQFRDLKAENRKARKEPPKPWGKKERLIVLFTLLITVLISGMLALSSRNFKLPKLPQFKFSSLSELNPFKEQVIVIGNKGSSATTAKIENTKRLFKEATDDYSGIYAFYIYDLNGDYYYGVGHQELMQAASLIKLPIMYIAIQTEEYKPLVEAMGKRSDNSAFTRMVNILGKEKINKTLLDLGMTKTSFTENQTTPEEVGLFFKKLYKNELLSKDLTEEFKSYLTDTIFEDWLRLGIPEDIEVIHKYGREVHSVSDAGIVDSDKPFVLVIMTDGVIEKEADELFPKLTKLLYDNHTGE